jgi:hypothetical protein
MSARQFRHRREPDARWTRPRAALTGAPAGHRDCCLRKGRADVGEAIRIVISVAVVSLAAATATCYSSRAEPAATELNDADAARIVGDLLNQ